MDADVIIVGQGLAGSSLAWVLHWLNLKVMLLDPQEEVTASSIAAGLLTPITGRKMVKTEDFERLFATAEQFYRRIEQETGESLFQTAPMLRVFQNEEEKRQFKETREQPYKEIIRSELAADGSLQGFQMFPAGRLKCEGYLRVTRKKFSDAGQFQTRHLILPEDVTLNAHNVEVSPGCLKAAVIVFCQGHTGRFSPWFPDIPNSPARGDILRVRISGLTETRICHSGFWLVPEGNEEYLVGSTYDWKDLSNSPSAAGRSELLEKLRKLVGRPVQVLRHQAAVRAGMKNYNPVTEWHKEHHRLAVFNGLGSKGSLLAPTLAWQLGRQIMERFEREFGVKKGIGNEQETEERASSITASTEFVYPFTQLKVEADVAGAEQQPNSGSAPSGSRRQSLTRLVHQILNRVIRPGDLVIDATLGNGHDTLFLAEQAGKSGRVIGFDVQETAIEATRRRLQQAGVDHAELRQQSHADIDQVASEQSVMAITFNLGYLPGGDKSVTTTGRETAEAVRKSASLLKSGGILTIIAYRGHPGGLAEANAVQQAVEQLAAEKYHHHHVEADPDNPESPLLFVVQRTAT